MSEFPALLSLRVRAEDDVVVAHQRARQIGARLGMGAQDQTRVATAVSEIARNALEHAGGGRVEFRAGGVPPELVIVVSDEGSGIVDVRAALAGRRASTTGVGAGLASAGRLMDGLDVRSEPGKGTVVRMTRRLPSGSPPVTPGTVAAISRKLAAERPRTPLGEVQARNQELLSALEELRAREDELRVLNRELEDTNRGVVALYAELDDKARALQLANETKTRFVSNMSHEFRTPLNAILSLSRLLLDRADGPLTPEQERQVEFIRRSADGLRELVNDLLDIAKVEAGKLDLRPTEFRLDEVLGSLRAMMRPAGQEAGATLVIEDAPDSHPLVTDEGKLSQVLRNLVSNALKFTPAGEVRVSAQAGPDDRVAFEVRDTGIGIAPEDQERIFEEFAQVPHALQEAAKGTGLGLPLSRRLAELLGGSLSVRSEPGIGSVFRLEIPRRHPDAAVGTAERREARPDARRARPVVLVVDDDEVARYLVRGLLAGLDLDLREAAGGADGLRAMREAAPDAVILDLVMPGVPGREVLAAMRADPDLAEVPVVVHTSQTLDATELRGALATVTAVVPKDPVPRDEARQRLLDALALAGIDGVREADRA